VSTAPALPAADAASGPLAVPLPEERKLAARPERAENGPAKPSRRGHGGALPE
jgi:hypothetical protein